jgi:hypothetical protein
LGGQLGFVVYYAKPLLEFCKGMENNAVRTRKQRHAHALNGVADMGRKRSRYELYKSVEYMCQEGSRLKERTTLALAYQELARRNGERIIIQLDTNTESSFFKRIGLVLF